MKTPHTSSSTIVTNHAHRSLIEDLERKHLEEGGAIFAQVYHDGMRVRVLTPQQTAELNEAFTRVLGEKPDSALRRSAFAKPGSAA